MVETVQEHIANNATARYWIAARYTKAHSIGRIIMTRNNEVMGVGYERIDEVDDKYLHCASYPQLYALVKDQYCQTHRLEFVKFFKLKRLIREYIPGFKWISLVKSIPNPDYRPGWFKLPYLKNKVSQEVLKQLVL